MNGYLEMFFPWLLRASWQAAVLVVVVLAVQWLCRKRLSARWLYALWFVVLVRLVLPSSPESAVSLFNLARLGDVEETAVGADVPGVEVLPVSKVELTEREESRHAFVEIEYAQSGRDFGFHEPLNRRFEDDGEVAATPSKWLSLERLPWLLGVVWGLGVLVLTGRIVWQSVRFATRLRRATVTDDVELLRLFEECKERFGLSRKVRLLETDAVKSPAVCGLVRPAVLLPRSVVTAFSREELRYVFLHELGHVKRGDLLVHWVASCLGVLHWFNPLIGYGFRRMAADRELACDEFALSHAREEDRLSYGSTIIKLLEHLPRPTALPGVVGILEDKHQMRRRIARIAKFRKRRRWSSLALCLIGILAVIGLTDARTSESEPETAGETLGEVVKKEESAKSETLEREIRLRVLDSETGEPLEGVSISAGGSPDEEFVTDINGICVVPVPQLRPGFYYRMTLRKEGYVAEYVSWSAYQKDEPDDVPAEYTARLEKGATIGGMVTDPEGRGIAGVRIDISGPSPVGTPGRERSTVMGSFHTEFTDENGTWRSDEMPGPLVPSLIYRLDHEAHVTEHFQADDGNRVGALRLNPADLLDQDAVMVLSRGIRISGTVVDSTGAPVHGATITQNREWDVEAASTSTDEDGGFLIKNAAPGELMLTIQAEGLAGQRVVVVAEEAMDPLRIVMEPGYSLRGRVVDESGAPIADAMVRVARLEFEPAFYPWRTRTDSEGRFHWDSAPVEVQHYTIRKSGYVPIREQALVADGKEKEISLASRVAKDEVYLSGKVTDKVTGQPVPEFIIELTENDGDGNSSFRRTFTEGSYSIQIDDTTVSYRVEIQADGYLSDRVARRVSEEKFTVDFDLSPSPNLAGKVFLPDGAPASGAEVALATDEEGVLLGKRRIFDRRSSIVADAADDGSFSFRPRANAHTIFAIHQEGFAMLNLDEQKPPFELKLLPWGTVEGTITDDGEPVAHAQMALNYAYPNPAYGLNLFHTVYDFSADGAGKFRIENVPPVDVRLIQFVPAFVRDTVVTVHPGTVTEVNLEIEGTTIQGRLTAIGESDEIDWQGSHQNFYLRSKFPEPAYRREEDAEVRAELHRAYWLSAEGKERQRTARLYKVKVDSDGAFIVENVKPGSYELSFDLYAPPEGRSGFGERLGSITTDVIVSEDSGVMNLGLIEIPLLKTLSAGDMAPLFSVESLDGGVISLEEYRGRYVLLDFWATWCGPCIAELPRFQAIHEEFGEDERLVIVSLSLDAERSEPRRFVSENEMKWVQGFLGEWSESSVTDEYGVYSIPATFLLGPDGRVLAKNLRGEEILSVVREALKR